jgi:hypothetical protein
MSVEFYLSSEEETQVLGGADGESRTPISAKIKPFKINNLEKRSLS